jgi:DNA-binding Xre family transcriptional regulator
MKKDKIRSALLKNRFYQYELAEWLGISETALIRLLRKDLPAEIIEKILNVIECQKTSQPYDNSFIREYMRKIDKRFNGRERTGKDYARYIAKDLDEAEKRRMEGGWDLSL